MVTRENKTINSLISQNIDLTNMSTLRVVASAEQYSAPQNLEELIEICKIAKSKNLPLNILGAGSNLLLSSRGIAGITVNMTAINFITKLNSTQFELGAGVKMPRFCAEAAKESLAGAEFMEGIPGTIGGGVVMNAGAHGSEIAKILKSLKLLNLETLEIEEYQLPELAIPGIPLTKIKHSEQLNQNYKDTVSQLKPDDEIKQQSQDRESKFEDKQAKIERSDDSTGNHKDSSNKETEKLSFSYRRSSIDLNKYIVVSASFELKPDDKAKIREKIIENNKARTSHQPIKAWTCGCTFKNPEGHRAGLLIDQLGAKGLSEGSFHVSNKHGNFFENDGGGSSIDFCKLMSKVQDIAFREKGAILSPEVKTMGEFTNEEKLLWHPQEKFKGSL